MEGKGSLVLFNSEPEVGEPAREDPSLVRIMHHLPVDWVMKKVEELQSCVGISCVGYAD